jgi:hypothetical protein
VADRTENSNSAGRGSTDANFAVSAPKITLPKGGGAISGIGEKFAANPLTGTGSMSVPLFTSPGRSGFGPQLSLSYDSGAGNGAFGFGWSLSLPSITRRTDKGLPKYLDAEESDIFILSGAEDLVPVLSKDNNGWERQTLDSPASEPGYIVRRYRPRIEGLLANVCLPIPIAAFRAKGRLRQLSAKSGLMHRSKKGLLDHLVGATGGNWVSRTAGWEGPNVIFPVWIYPLRGVWRPRHARSK